jgi:hypothetical protein
MQIAKSEKVLFVETFDDNSAGWSNVAGEPTTGAAMIGKDPVTGEVSVWMPSLDDKQSVTSNVTLKQAVDLSDGPVALYLRWRADLQYRVEGGKGASKTAGSGHVVRFPDTATYLTYRLLITPRGSNGMTLEAFRYDAKENRWVSLGEPANDAFTDTQVFDRVTLNTRNGVKGYVDAVALTRPGR